MPPLADVTFYAPIVLIYRDYRGPVVLSAACANRARLSLADASRQANLNVIAFVCTPAINRMVGQNASPEPES